MSRATLDHRLGRVERARGTVALSPAIRRWLGHLLTPAEHAFADAEQKIMATRRIDLSALAPAARTWRAEWGDVAGDRITQLGDHR